LAELQGNRIQEPHNILKKSDLLELELESLDAVEFTRVKEKRDNFERKRLEQTKTEEQLVPTFEV
jgi:hypothetical protein